MAIWLIRAGQRGEYEQQFLNEQKVYVTWDRLKTDLSKLDRREALIEKMTAINPDTKFNAIRNYASQIWPFAHDMKQGDLVILPLKTQPAIQIGEIIGDYSYSEKAENPYYHSRKVKWIGEAIPRSNFAQDLLYSFGAFMTICRITRNNAEERLAAMRAANWAAETTQAAVNPATSPTEESVNAAPSDLEELGMDQIARLIEARFKGHKLTALVDAILKAQGYTTYVSPPGADGGADILAGAGPLGFGQPRLCIEVKSGDTPTDRPAVDKLLGAITKIRSTGRSICILGRIQDYRRQRNGCRIFQSEALDQKGTA
jgi:restriction system protein